MTGCIELKTRRSRQTWVRAHGPVPDGLWVLHRCDNELCVNLEHLYLGTPKDNHRDMLTRGRYNIEAKQKTMSAIALARSPETVRRSASVAGKVGGTVGGKKTWPHMVRAAAAHRKCSDCGFTSSTGHVGAHLKKTRHSGWEPV